MSDRSRIGTRTVSGLRTRFFPKSRVGHGVISVAPWIDIVLLVIFFVLLDAKIVLRPGFVVEPPSSSYLKGSKSDLLAIVKSIDSMGSNGKEEIIFFDDKRFIVKSESQMKSLEENLKKKAKKASGKDLIIISDKNIRHETIVRLVDMAHYASIANVSIATKHR